MGFNHLVDWLLWSLWLSTFLLCWVVLVGFRRGRGHQLPTGPPRVPPVDWLRLVGCGVVVVRAQDVCFQGRWCPLRGSGLEKASACLQANDVDARGLRSPLEASLLSLLVNPL
jgi:hypothetical protein